MKYRNAADILPDTLMRELQKYAAGKLLYVPKPAARRPWGEASGARSYYTQRNEALRARFRAGESIAALAAEYHLSPETVRRILYT